MFIPEYFAHKIITCVFILASTVALTGCSDKTSLQPLDASTTILAFGDSLTYGTGASRDKAYPAILEKLTHHKVINAGVPGEISAAGLARLPALLDRYHPGLVIICHGGNDILRKMNLSQTRDNIQSMITLLRDRNIQVLLVGVPEFGLFLNSSPIYQRLADDNQVPITNNILPEILAESSLKSDQVHPNAQGYQLLAKNISLTLQHSGALPSQL